MEILYISKLLSTRLINKLVANSCLDSGFAVQKFGRLVARGFVLNDVGCDALSSLPKKGLRKILTTEKAESEKGVTYHYIPSVNIPVIRQLVQLFYSLFFSFRWCKKKGGDKAIVCDALDISICIGGLLVAKICGIKNICVLTDMPGLMIGQGNSFFWKVVTRVNKTYLSSFDGYVFLTQQMNARVNIKNRPFIIMEGLVDSEASMPVIDVCPNTRRTVLYAGGLHERYGLKTLVDAFVSLDIPDTKLIIYGSGPYEKELLRVCERETCVEFRGVAPNEIVLEAEERASLLVNPRPTAEEFTRYSFPSKNLEYMASGTPLLTTKLPGMPKEYYPFVFLFEEETVEGYAKAILDALSRDLASLQEKGRKAREFVLKHKNNKVQTKRILNLIGY
ncbi:MAG: glycosyltransferase [Bacteroidales bacterium]|nr:glycosyltransferase [Bacteroidales bacterium]